MSAGALGTATVYATALDMRVEALAAAHRQPKTEL